jgi:hypothetical protein
MAGADTGLVWISVDSPLLSGHYRTWGIADRVLHIGEALNELAKVHSATKFKRYVVGIGSQAIGADLEVARGGVIQFAQEPLAVEVVTATDLESQNHFAGPLNRNPGPAIAELWRAVTIHAVAHPHSDKAVNFVALDIVHLQVADLSGKESLTPFADAENQVAQGIAANAGDAFDGSDRHAFQEHTKRGSRFPVGNPKIAVGGFGLVDEGLAASAAAATGLALGIGSVFLGFLMLAGGDDHSVLPLNGACRYD